MQFNTQKRDYQICVKMFESEQQMKVFGVICASLVSSTGTRVCNILRTKASRTKELPFEFCNRKAIIFYFEDWLLVSLIFGTLVLLLVDYETDGIFCRKAYDFAVTLFICFILIYLRIFECVVIFYTYGLIHKKLYDS